MREIFTQLIVIIILVNTHHTPSSLVMYKKLIWVWMPNIKFMLQKVLHRSLRIESDALLVLWESHIDVLCVLYNRLHLEQIKQDLFL